MSRVITFSRQFPKGHPHEGEPTGFVAMIRAGIKKHTIRANNNWKPGDFFSPRFWTGKPYRSKQGKILKHDLQVVKTWDFEIDQNGVIVIGGYYLTDDSITEKLANNDGLSPFDFYHWFSKPFKGQIICWDKYVEYVNPELPKK